MSGYEKVRPAEHSDRKNRVLSVPCPRCGAADGRGCVSPGGTPQPTHGARWDAWYAAHPEAVTP